MKKLAVLLLICCMCSACGTPEDVTVDVPGQAEETLEVTEETPEITEETPEITEETPEITEETPEITEETPEVTEETPEITEEAPEVTEETPEVTKEDVSETDAPEEIEGTERAIISPLPSTIDMDAPDNCTLAVSFEKGDAYVDDTGKMQLDVTVYTYDLYDMVDIANLKEGDIIVIQGTEVLVKSVEISESGSLCINGGLDNGGYDLWHDESGVYFERGYSDVKSYYAMGETTIRVSTDFKFVDSSDLDQGEVTYYPGDFLTDNAGILYNFTPNNTSIVVENGQIIYMTRVYTP